MPRHRPARLGPALLAVALLALAACSAPAPDGPPDRAAGFRLPRAGGGQVELSQYQGQVVLLDFWATWCPPCRAAMPHLAKLQETHRAAGLVVLGMNLDHNQDDLEQFLASQTINYPVLQVDAATRAAYGGVASIPQTFLIDRAGRVRHKFLGYDHRVAAQLDLAVQELLEEAVPSP